MRELVIDQDIPLAEDKRLIKKLWKIDKNHNFPDGLEFAYQFLYCKNELWIQVARIDNQLHEGLIISYMKGKLEAISIF